MAFLIGAAIRGSVSAVQSGIQAHKDFNNPEGPQPRTDSYGNVRPAPSGPVYGLVMKAEKSYAARKNKGEGGQSVDASSGSVFTSGVAPMQERRSMEKTECAKEEATKVDPDAPPPYSTGAPPPPAGPPQVAGFGGPPNAPPTAYAPPSGAPRGLHRSGSTSSSSSGSSEERAHISTRMAATSGGFLTDRRARRAQRRIMTAEYRAQKHEARAERHRRRAERLGGV